MVTRSLRESGCHLREPGIAPHTRPPLEQPAVCTAHRLPDPGSGYRPPRMQASAAHVLGYNRPPKQAPASTQSPLMKNTYKEADRDHSSAARLRDAANQRRVG